MDGLIYEMSNGKRAFIQLDSIITIKEKSDGFEVWYAKGYTNATAMLSKSELTPRKYVDFLDYYIG